MYATQSLLFWLSCATPALTAIVSPQLVQPRATTGDTINATLNSQGDATVDTPQFLASLLTPHFDLTCSPVSGKKRRGKRDLTNDDKSCIVDSAFSLATFAASNLQVQNAMSTIPLNFDVKGGLIDVKTQVRVKIQQRPSQFTARIFSPQQISSTIAYFATLAGYVEKEGPGVPITHIVFTLSDSETQATASCSSWTFTWTSPKPSQTIIPASPCIPVQTGIAYEGTDPIMWAQEIAQYKVALAAPRISASTSAPTPSPAVPGDTICRSLQYWYYKCQFPSTESYPNGEVENCITNFQNPDKNPTWPLDGMMQPGSANISMPYSSNKGTVYFVIIVSWEPNCQADTPNGKMSVVDPTGFSFSSTYTFPDIIRNIYKGCLDFALYLDPNTQMLSQVPNSAGIGKEIKSLNPNNDAYIPFNNYALGGRRKIGCLNYEFVSSKNNDGIDMDMTNYINGHEGHIAWPNPTAQREFYKDNWPTLGEKFYAYDDGNGQYCPNTFKWSGTAYPCPAYPCWNGPPETPETTDPPPHVGAPPHFGAPPNRELLVMHSNSSSSNTTSNNTTSANAMSPAQLGKRGSVKKLPSGSL